MTPADVIPAVAAVGGTLAVDEGNLRVRAPRGALKPDLWAAIQAHKADPIAALAPTPDVRWRDSPEAAAPIVVIPPRSCLAAIACARLGPCPRGEADEPCAKEFA